MAQGSDRKRDRDVVRGRLWPPAALVVSGVLAAAYFLLPTGGMAQAILLLLLTVAAPALLAIRLLREGLLGRWPWVLFMLATGLYAVAAPFWGVLPIATGREIPFPSPVDGLFFASYGLAAAFLVSLLSHRHANDEQASRGGLVALLDAGIFAIAMLAVLWPWLIGPNLGDPAIGVGTQAVAMGYPLLTAVLFGLVARLAVSTRTWTPELLLLLLWAGGELAGDVFYGYLGATGEFFYGHPVSAFWLVSYVALGALALHPRLLHLHAADGQLAVGESRLWFPLGAVVLPLVVSLFVDSLLLGVVAIGGVLLLIARLRLMSGDLVVQRRLAAELAALSRQLEHQSLHDALTGLPNRTLFAEHLELAWANHQRHARGLSVLAIDLDGFKQVNDLHGHRAGDRVLVETARRMLQCVREGDTLARLSGDEFAAILPETGTADATAVAERIRDELARPLALDEQAHTITVSIGIAAVHERQAGPEALVHEADIAMYAAKAAGKDTHAIYRPGLERNRAVTLPGVVPAEAAAWAAYVRTLRREIADRKATSEMAPTTRAPQAVHRTLEQVLGAVDQVADAQGDATTLLLPARAELEEFVHHHTAVQHWADRLAEQGRLTVARSAEADRFWTHLVQHTVASPDA